MILLRLGSSNTRLCTTKHTLNKLITNIGGKMKKEITNKLEQNIMLAIFGTKRVMDIFLGPFLTAYFIKTSSESITDLSVHYVKYLQ